MLIALKIMLLVIAMSVFTLVIFSLCARGKVRRIVLSCFGLLRYEPGDHRCHFCDLFDDERSACLVFVKTAKGLRNLRMTRFSMCAWRGQARRYVSVLDVDTEVERLKMELEGAKAIAYDQNGDAGDGSEIHSSAPERHIDSSATTDANDEDSNA